MTARAFTVLCDPTAQPGYRFRVVGALAADRKMARWLADGEGLQDLLAAVEAEGAPGVLPFAKPVARKVERKAKRAVRNASVGAIRAAVMLRAAGMCECGCCRFGPLEMDHFRGGSRRRSHESVEGCWALLTEHHQAKSENKPSAEHWRARFAAHCRKYGYPTPGGT